MVLERATTFAEAAMTDARIACTLAAAVLAGAVIGASYTYRTVPHSPNVYAGELVDQAAR